MILFFSFCSILFISKSNCCLYPNRYCSSNQFFFHIFKTDALYCFCKTFPFISMIPEKKNRFFNDIKCFFSRNKNFAECSAF